MAHHYITAHHLRLPDLHTCAYLGSNCDRCRALRGRLHDTPEVSGGLWVEVEEALIDEVRSHGHSMVHH